MVTVLGFGVGQGYTREGPRVLPRGAKICGVVDAGPARRINEKDSVLQGNWRTCC